MPLYQNAEISGANSIRRSSSDWPNSASGNWTIMIWAKLMVAPSNGKYHTAWSFDNGGSTDYVYIEPNAGTSPFNSMTLWIPGQTNTTIATLQQDVWQNWCVTKTGLDYATYYKNGNVHAPLLAGGTRTSTQDEPGIGANLRVGNTWFTGGGDTFRGALCCFKIWTRALTAAQIDLETKFIEPQFLLDLYAAYDLMAWPKPEALPGYGRRRELTYPSASTVYESIGPSPPGLLWRPEPERVYVVFTATDTPVSSSVESSWESLGRIATATDSNHEGLGLIVVAGEGSHEALGRIVLPGESSHEVLGRVPSAAESSWESLGRLVTPEEASHEALGRVPQAVESSWESLGRVVASGESAHEALGRIVQSIEASHEALGRIASAVETSWESTGATAVSNAIESSWESLGRLVAQIESSWESLGRLVVSGESAHEALGRIVQSGESSLEALGLVARGLESSIEALGRVVTGQESSQEALGRIATALESAHEALGRLLRSEESSWESIAGLTPVANAIETSIEALGRIATQSETSYEGWGALLIAIIHAEFEVAKVISTTFEIQTKITTEVEM